MSPWKISADTGGTFTDCLIEAPDGSIRRAKVLSNGRLKTRILEIQAEHRLRIEPLPVRDCGFLKGRKVWITGRLYGHVAEVAEGWIELDPIVGNGPREMLPGEVLEIDSGFEAPVLAMQLHLPEGLVERNNSVSFRLGTTKGTNALLENNGAPVALFLSAGFTDLLEIRDQKRPDLFAMHICRPAPIQECAFGIGGAISSTGAEIEPLDEAGLRKAAQQAMDGGCQVAAVCLKNSWCNPIHEHRAGEILGEAGFSVIRLSADIRPLIKYLDRAETTLVDASLSPVLGEYLDRVQQALRNNPLWIMTSSAGLVSRDRFHPVDSLVSGPAGGVLGAVAAGRKAGMERLICLDMGGTSTDVSRWNHGIELRQQIQVGRARILTPAMPIQTVAAGGGSICGFDGERLFVGPESAGADPGPAAYGAGGPLTLTDIHLLLGRMDPDAFSIPIDVDSARKALMEIVGKAGEKDWRRMAEGFLVIATERMAQAIHQVSLRDGENPGSYSLVAFGGAGGLHACRVADLLGMKEILLPGDAGLLSAVGIHHAPREAVLEKQVLRNLEEILPDLPAAFRSLEVRASQVLLGDGVPASRIEPPACTVFIRMKGQEQGIPLSWEPGCDLGGAYRKAFTGIFGYFPPDPELEVVRIRLRSTECSDIPSTEIFDESGRQSQPLRFCSSVRGGVDCAVPVHDRINMQAGMSVKGPAILTDPFGTCFVEEGWIARKGSEGSIRLVPQAGRLDRDQGTHLVNVEKTLVINRLENLVEEMGDQLQRTALSTNIRERLDYSCALLDARGNLLVNAPHIPVHLGAMGMCVRQCARDHAFNPGDILITNHPGHGGSHLPDVTLMCGLFAGDGRLMGYLANRAHHAEWGGISPGSMPAAATSLEEEGVVLSPQWLLRDGCDRFGEVESLLVNAPYPSRAPRENRIDLEAQVASLLRGADMFRVLLEDYPKQVIEGYFEELYQMGKTAMGKTLKRLKSRSCKAEERLDDGHAIRLSVDWQKDRLVLDFSGTDPVHPGNLNATPAIVRSAVLYVLRLMVGIPMPLNEGLLENVDIRLPRCFLNPGFSGNASQCPAVVGGNVETSQRVVEVLIRAFDLLAGSQGTMNNLLFGNQQFGYYETIGGGSGAGKGFAGTSGVHVHMTNTAITDPEVLESRFPVFCREFSIRKGSGGKGLYPGGDGLVRELVFREAVSLSLLCQGRLAGGRGAHGGGDGLPGKQWILGLNGNRREVPGIHQVDLKPGEGLRIETPGGGAWGSAAG